MKHFLDQLMIPVSLEYHFNIPRIKKRSPNIAHLTNISTKIVLNFKFCSIDQKSHKFKTRELEGKMRGIYSILKQLVEIGKDLVKVEIVLEMIAEFHLNAQEIMLG